MAANDPSIIGTQFENFAPCGGVAGSLNIIAEAFEVNPSDDWNDFSPKLAAQYYPNDQIMLFGSISKGFKSGGFAGSQGVESSASNPVDQETAINYEFGLKGDLLDNTLRLNLTAFFTDYEDQQVVRFGPVPGSAFGTFVTTNIGSAEIKGIELEWNWYITERLRLAGHYGYLDTEVEDLIFEVAAGTVDASGKSLTRAPENSGNVALIYEQPITNGDLDFRIEFTHADEGRQDFVDDRIFTDSYDLLDARIGWTSSDGRWEVAAWGKNLTDEDYISHMYVIGPGGIGVWGPPRTYGLNLIWKN